MLGRKATRSVRDVFGLRRKGSRSEQGSRSSELRERAPLGSYVFAGAVIITDFVSDVEKIYQAADLYIFPGSNETAAIDIPLSVLEAMAVNLPVLTTPFGGLPDLFDPAPWFRYADGSENLLKALEQMISQPVSPSRTREMVLPYTWEGFAEKIYSRCLKVLKKETPTQAEQRNRRSSP